MRNKRRICRHKKSRSRSQRGIWLGIRRCLVLLICVGPVWGAFDLGMFVVHSSRFELHTIQVRGEVAHVDVAHLQTILKANTEGNFFTVDIARIRQAVVALPWVDRVAIRRVWPDTLRVFIIEKTPVARWSDKGLLTESGVVIAANVSNDGDLPFVDGAARIGSPSLSNLSGGRSKVDVLGVVSTADSIDYGGGLGGDTQ